MPIVDFPGTVNQGFKTANIRKKTPNKVVSLLILGILSHLTALFLKKCGNEITLDAVSLTITSEISSARNLGVAVVGTSAVMENPRI